MYMHLIILLLRTTLEQNLCCYVYDYSSIQPNILELMLGVNKIFPLKLSLIHKLDLHDCLININVNVNAKVNANIVKENRIYILY